MDTDGDRNHRVAVDDRGGRSAPRRPTGWPQHRADAPRDYGAILPPELADEGRTWQALLFEAGFAGIHWPDGVRWSGTRPRSTTRPGSPSAPWPRSRRSSTWWAACSPVPPCWRSAHPNSRREHLRPIITGERIWCQLFSEPDAGSDLASPVAPGRARRRRLRGQRPEGVVLQRTGGRLGHPHGPHRPRRPRTRASRSSSWT